MQQDLQMVCLKLNKYVICHSCHLYPPEVLGSVSETQLQACENLNTITYHYRSSQGKRHLVDNTHSQQVIDQMLI